jgi:cyclopropane fatty-acyl-phospholipid synthase-like methyltransferase
MSGCVNSLANPAAELERLAKAADWYDSRQGMSYHLVRAGAEIVLKYAAGPRLLEMGCANGVMTEIFAKHFSRVVVVEGSSVYAETARGILRSSGEVHCCLFEEFAPDEAFDDIVMAGVLEHVADPLALLQRAVNWLVPGGNIHILVPHAMSLHRRAGVALGLLARPDELNAADFAMGHRRIYTWDLLEYHLAESGLQILAREGNFLKPLSNQQMEGWPENLLEAFEALGRDFPEMSAEIYALCRPVQED